MRSSHGSIAHAAWHIEVMREAGAYSPARMRPAIQREPAHQRPAHTPTASLRSLPEKRQIQVQFPWDGTLIRASWAVVALLLLSATASRAASWQLFFGAGGDAA